MAKPKRKLPPDFAERAPTLNVSEAMVAWQVAYPLLVRWEDETGVKCRRDGKGRKARSA